MQEFDVNKFDIGIFNSHEITKELIEYVIDDFINIINDNDIILNEVIDIDYKYFNNKILKENILERIKEYRDFTEVSINQTNKLVCTNGNPELIVDLCMQAFLTNTQIVIMIEDFMKATNDFLVNAFKKIMEKYDIYNIVYIYNNINYKDIEKIKNMFDGVISIGDSVIKELLDDSIYIPYKNLDLFYDNDLNTNNIELKKTIIKEATSKMYEIEIFSAENIDEIIDLVRNDKYKDEFVILSNNIEVINTFRRVNFNKKIYINDNPFIYEEKIKRYL